MWRFLVEKWKVDTKRNESKCLFIEKNDMPAEKIECLQWFYFLTAKTNDLNEVCGGFIFFCLLNCFSWYQKSNEKIWNGMKWNEMNTWICMKWKQYFCKNVQKNQKWFETRFWKNVTKFNENRNDSKRNDSKRFETIEHNNTHF